MLKYFAPKERTKESTVIASSIDTQPESSHQASIPSLIPTSNPKVNQKWKYLIFDPAKRQQIIEYHPDNQDEIRRAYLLKGPTRIYLEKYPVDNSSGTNRSFVKTWFKEYDWLEYSLERDAVFCLPCYLFYNGSGKTTFIKEGYRAWHLKRNLKKHVGSNPNSHHNICVRKCDDLLNQKQSITSSLSNYSEKEKSEYLIRLKASLEVVKYLVRGGLAFRGRDEGKNSVYKDHFLEFVEALGRNCEKIGEAIKNLKGNLKMTSPRIQKDLVNACVTEIVKKIIDEIGDDVFCVLVDESGDQSEKEQMAVVLCYVDDKGFVLERLVGIVHVEETSAITLKGALENLLSRLGLCIAKIRGQGYDGASNMNGCFGGLKTLIQKENPQAYYVHCFAHQLQLALVSVVRFHDDVRSFFTEVTRIVNLIRSSNKRQDMLRREQITHIGDLIENDMLETDIGLNQELSLGRTCDTRWGSHFRVLLRLKKIFTPIVEVFKELRSDRNLNGEAKGVTNELSQALQRSDQDILNAMQLVEVNKKMIQQMRDNGWEEFLERVLLSSQNLHINVPDMDEQYFKDNRSQHNIPFVTTLHYYKYDCFFRVIDLVLKELNERFNPENTELLHCVACLSPCDSFETFDTKSIVRMAKLYPNDFLDVDDEELSAQLEAYIYCVRMDSNFSNLNGLSDLSKTLVRTKKHKTFRFVYKLVKLALTLPVATATIERVFSGMNYVKDELRNKMCNPWVNDCLITFVEKEVFSTVDDKDIINRFQHMAERRMPIKLK